MSYFCKRFQFGLAAERRCKDMKRNRKVQSKAGLIRLKAISKPCRENRRRMEDGRESVAWTGGVKNANERREGKTLGEDAPIVRFFGSSTQSAAFGPLTMASSSVGRAAHS